MSGAEKVAHAIIQVFFSNNVADWNGEASNVVDVLHDIAISGQDINLAIRDLAEAVRLHARIHGRG